jgi:hypothetical protein
LPDRLPSLSHLRVFCEAARHGSLSSAARAVHLSQPAITQAMQAVERAIGAQLLVRSSMGVALTAAGAAALPRFERLLAQLAMAPSGPGRGQGTRVTRATDAITFSQLSALMAVVDQGGFRVAARARARNDPSGDPLAGTGAGSAVVRADQLWHRQHASGGGNGALRGPGVQRICASARRSRGAPRR